MCGSGSHVMSNLRPDCSHLQISSETSSLTESVEFPIQIFNPLSRPSHMQTIRTNHTFITLRSVEPSISGKYVCEISADAPSFHTQIGELIAG